MSELIDEVKVFPLDKPVKNLLANTSFRVAESFVVRAKIVKTEKGMLVSMPSQRYEKVLDAYNEAVGEEKTETKKSKKKAPF